MRFSLSLDDSPSHIVVDSISLSNDDIDHIGWHFDNLKDVPQPSLQIAQLE